MGSLAQVQPLSPSGPEVLLGFGSIALWLLLAISMYKIVTKAGYSRAWVAVGFVPLLNLVALVVFAFSDWPVLRETVEARPPRAPAG